MTKAKTIAGLIWLFCSLLFVPLCLWAAEADGDFFVLEDTLVTAFRTDKDPHDTPRTVYAVSSETLQNERMVRTVPETLKEVPGVMAQKTAHGQGSPFIRGFTGFRTLFMIDGIRLNNSVFRDGPNQYWNTVDPYSLERLEIIKGPGSVLYGSDAVGGSVNALTVRPPYKEGEGYSGSGRVHYRWSDAENSHIGRVQAGANLDEKWGFLVGVTLKDFGNLEGGGDVGEQEKTGYDEWNGDLKLEYSFTPDSQLIFAYQKVDQDDVWRTHKTEYGISWEGTTVGSEHARILDQDRELLYLQYSGQEMGSVLDRMILTLSYHSQAEERYRLRTRSGSLRSDVQGVDVDTTGISAQIDTPTDFGTWTYGFEYYHDEVESYKRDYNGDVRDGGTLRSMGIQGPVGDDANYDNLGIYIHDDIPVGDSLDLMIGARYNFAKAEAGKVQDPMTGEQISLKEDWDAVVGSLRALYRLDTENRYHLFGGVSQGFRAPNLSDLTRLDTARSNEIETPAPGLASEKYMTYELGLKTKQEKYSSQLAYFYTDIEDMIVRTPTGRVLDGDNEVTKKNAGDGYVQGIELSLTWRIHSDFSTFGSFSWLDGEVDTYPTSSPEKVREPIDRLMPMTFQAGLRWTPSTSYWLEASITVADDQDELSTRDRADTQRIPPGGTPGYEVFTIRGGWKINELFALLAALENITDEDYRIHGSGLNEPGRNFVISLDGRF